MSNSCEIERQRRRRAKQHWHRLRMFENSRHEKRVDEGVLSWHRLGESGGERSHCWHAPATRATGVWVNCLRRGRPEVNSEIGGDRKEAPRKHSHHKSPFRSEPLKAIHGVPRQQWNARPGEAVDSTSSIKGTHQRQQRRTGCDICVELLNECRD